LNGNNYLLVHHFFQRYKHYIILLLSTPDQNQFIEWSGLVEAKVRILIGNLERNSYIDIAHVSSDKYTPDESVFEQQQQQTNKTSTENVNSNGHNSPGLESSTTNPIQQSSSSPSNTPPTFSGMWVVGLQFKNVNKVQLDLTEEIRIFLSVVYKASANSNMNRENLNLDARYIRRRDLHTVLPKHAVSTLNHSPRLSKTMSVEDKLDTLKRPKLHSTSSDSGLVADSDNETKAKRQKLEEINESSPKTNLDPV